MTSVTDETHEPQPFGSDPIDPIADAGWAAAHNPGHLGDPDVGARDLEHWRRIARAIVAAHERIGGSR